MASGFCFLGGRNLPVTVQDDQAQPDRFRHARSAAKSIRRAAEVEIEAALSAIRQQSDDDAVHTVRQRLKRLRALVRLPRPYFPGYGAENLAFRDLGRKLSATRDARVVLRTLDKLASREGVSDLDGVHRGLQELSAPVAGSDVRALLDGEVTAGLLAARTRARRWRFARKGFDLIGPGLQRVYREMRELEAVALEQPTATNIHEWRKAVKYHANQLALLVSVAPEILSGYRLVADKLVSALGKHHDLDVLSTRLQQLDAGKHGQGHQSQLGAAIHRRNAELEQKAFRLGNELTAERPAEFLDRIEAGWRSWRG